MGEEVVKLLAENWSTINGRRRGGRRNPKLPELVRVAGGFRAWSEAYGTELPAMGVDGQRTTAGGTWVEEEEEVGEEVGEEEDDSKYDASGTEGRGRYNGRYEGKYDGGGSDEGDAEDEYRGADHGQTSGDVWRAIADVSTNTLVYENAETGRRVKVRPLGARVLVESVEQGGQGGQGGEERGGRGGSSKGNGKGKGKSTSTSKSKSSRRGRRGAPLTPELKKELSDEGKLLFGRATGASMGEGEGGGDAGARLFDDVDEDTTDDDDRVERQEQEAKEAADAVEQEDAQLSCDLCKDVLIDPVRLARCRCALCDCCRSSTVYYARQCPVCDAPVRVSKGGAGVVSDADELRRRIVLCEQDGELASDFDRQRLRQSALADRRRAMSRVVLEYGNTTKEAGAGGKTAYTTFLKVRSCEGLPKGQVVVARVGFNINPGFAKPTATVLKPPPKGASYCYAMARPFPCHISVAFDKALALPALTLEYCVQDAPMSRRVVVEFPRISGNGAPPRRSREKMVEVDADPPRNLWVTLGGAAQGGDVNHITAGFALTGL